MTLSTSTRPLCTCRHHVPSKLERDMLATLTEMNAAALAATSERQYAGISETCNRMEAKLLKLERSRLAKASKDCPEAHRIAEPVGVSALRITDEDEA